MKTPAILFLALALTACGGESADSPNTSTADTTASQPVEPEKPAYSAAEADKLAAKLGECDSPYGCEALDQLIAFGADAIPNLTKVATDGAQSEQARENALYGLQEIGENPGGRELYEAGKESEDAGMRRELFGAAAVTTDPALLDEMLDYAISAEAAKAEQETELLIGLKEANSAQVMQWVRGKDKFSKKEEIPAANLIQDHAAESDLDFVKGLIESFKDPMAKNRLGLCLIDLGDMSGFDPLFKSMKSGDKYDRSDAAGFFVEAADKCPDDRKEEAVKLLKKIKDENVNPYYAGKITKAIEALEK